MVDAPAWPEHGSVAVDDEGGARAAAEHLLALGHRDLLVISMETPPLAVEASDSVMGRRLRGYQAVLQQHGIELGAERVVVAPASFEGGEAAFLRAWEDGLRATGVLSMSDAAAAGVLQAARQVGLHVPRELSVIGFDDLPLTRFTDPPLTTVHQPVRRKGEEAARLLLEALAPGAGRRGEHRILETRLVVRRSTAPARASQRQEVIAAP
jgi:DNA-binding LacI/PurR family transcriptional regulator